MKLKHQHILNWLVLLTLAIFAILFYKERTCTLDAAYQGGSVFIRDSLAIQIKRFGAAFVQAFPLYSMRMGGTLKTSLILYSLAYIIEAALVYWILAHRLKQVKLGTALIIYLTVMVGHTFYWAQSELLQTSVLSFLFGGLILYKTQSMSWGRWLLIVALQVVILFTHPLGFIPLLFFWGFGLLDNKFKVPWHYYGLLVAGGGIVAYKYLAMPLAHYDKLSIGHTSTLIEKVSKFYELQSTRDFWTYVQHDYFFFIPIFLLSLVYYFINKQILKGLFVFFAFFCTWLLINGSYHWGIMQFHVESFYRILVIFPAVAIGWDILNDKKWQKAIIVALAFIFIVRLNKIYHHHWEWSDRLDYYRELVQSTQHIDGDKFYIFRDDAPQPLPHNSWPSGMETLLLTSLETPDNIRSVIIIDPKNSLVKKLQTETGTFCSSFETMSVEKLKNGYFPLSKSAYIHLKKEDLK